MRYYTTIFKRRFMFSHIPCHVFQFLSLAIAVNYKYYISIYTYFYFCVPIHSRLVNAWRNVRDAEKDELLIYKCDIPVCLTFRRGFVTQFNAILTNLDPFHTIEQKRHSILMAIDLRRFLRQEQPLI